MKRLAPVGLLFAFVAACAPSQATHVSTVSSASASPSPSPAPVASASPEPSSATSSPPPRGPSATDRVRERVATLEPAQPESAAWIPFEIIDAVDRVGGELGASSRPEVTGDRVVWSLVLPAQRQVPDPASFEGVCNEVMQTDPHLACAVDVFAVGATDRIRFAFAWRRAPGTYRFDVALPLRALSRIHTGICVVSIERSAQTLDIRLQVPDVAALGRTLARLTSLSPISDLILVGMQPAQLSHGQAEAVTLSWPTDRVDRDHADLGTDAWPTRCDERQPMSHEAAPHSPITALLAITGERSRGAIVNIAHREWFVTEGDTIADARITAVSPEGVYIARNDRPRARPQLVRYATPPARPAHSGSSSSPPPIRIPLPPEPPAALP